MSKTSGRFVARAEAGKGWRIYDRMMKKWWGDPFPACPYELRDELNGQKRPQRIVELTRRIGRRDR